jgi:DNA-3-methyladenine glycosylase I
MLHEVSGFCPLGGLPAVSDDDYFEALTAAVFSMRFRAPIVAARWPHMRRALADFRLAEVAAWPNEAVERLLQAPGVIRNPKKLRATLRNARDLAARAAAHGSVAAYLDCFRPDVEALVAELDRWVHYLGAPSLRFFLRCTGIQERWAAEQSGSYPM